MKDICPAGREKMNSDYVLDCCSRGITSGNLPVLIRAQGDMWLQWAACSLVRQLFTNLIKAMICMDDDAGNGLDMMSRLLGGIDSLQILGLNYLNFPNASVLEQADLS